MKRKKWSEVEEQTLLSKYNDLKTSGSLSKLKTREKKFRPIADHVNAVHHLQDSVAFPFKWSWRDVSIKFQNMRHQYIGVKQKIRVSKDEFNWKDGEHHWENFLRYKEVFGDVELLNSRSKKFFSFSDNNSSSDLFRDCGDLGLGFDSDDLEEEDDDDDELEEDGDQEEGEDEDLKEGESNCDDGDDEDMGSGDDCNNGEDQDCEFGAPIYTFPALFTLLISSQSPTKMVFHLYRLAEWIVYQLLANSFYRAAKKARTFAYYFRLRNNNPSPKSKQHHVASPGSKEINTLLRTDSFFPYFMLVAFEGGSILRAFLLLVSYPVVWFLDYESQLKAMIFITFCGLKVKDMESVSRAVLPKFYLENLHFQAYNQLIASSSNSNSKAVVITGVPRVMVEVFLKEYLGVENVIGTELSQVSGKGSSSSYFTGFVSGNLDVGIGCSSSDHLFLSFCKEGNVVYRADSSNSAMPRDKYPKQLIFHDGRLAFLPTPSETIAMFCWIPIGILLAVFRLLAGILLPYKIALLLARMSGVRVDFHDSRGDAGKTPGDRNGGVLYVCTHRTLLDPVFLSTCLHKPLTAVTYSLSKMSELIAPIRTVRLTRDRTRDGETMERMLREGDLVVCPEGTTCREPYLLRFSSLFAELSDEIVPVAVNTSVGMFYGTTASGLKWLDPIFFLMNPRPVYWIRVLEKLPAEMTCGGGGKSSWDVANYIQKQLAGALGFECTSLTRKDKYLMLAGNEGIVERR